MILIKGGMMKLLNMNLNAYEFHVFTIFHHYWKLLVYSTKQGRLSAYDKGRNSNDRIMH